MLSKGSSRYVVKTKLQVGPVERCAAWIFTNCPVVKRKQFSGLIGIKSRQGFFEAAGYFYIKSLFAQLERRRTNFQRTKKYYFLGFFSKSVRLFKSRNLQNSDQRAYLQAEKIKTCQEIASFCMSESDRGPETGVAKGVTEHNLREASILISITFTIYFSCIFTKEG